MVASVINRFLAFYMCI